jgi:hypothetical protein
MNEIGIVKHIFDDEEVDLKIDLNLKKTDTKNLLDAIYGIYGYGGYVYLGINKNINYYTSIKKGMQYDVKIVDMLDKINDGVRPEPEEIKSWLKIYFNTVYQDDPALASMGLVGLLHYINNNYEFYRKMLLDVLVDNAEVEGMRIALLDVAENNFSKHEEDVCVNLIKKKNIDNLKGKCSVSLAKNGINVSDIIYSVIENSSLGERYSYYISLGLVGADKFPEIIENDLDYAYDMKDYVLMSSIIFYLKNSKINNDKKLLTLNRIIDYKTNELNGKYRSISIQAVNALSGLDNEESFRKLVEVVLDDGRNADVRLTALETMSFYKGVNENKKLNYLENIRKNIDYKKFDEIDRSRLNTMFDKVFMSLKEK